MAVAEASAEGGAAGLGYGVNPSAGSGVEELPAAGIFAVLHSNL